MSGKYQDYRKNISGVSAQGEGQPSEVWRDGLYSVTFFVEGGSEENSSDALAVLRDGAILGSDKFGGVFEGRLVGKSSGNGVGFSLRVRIPAGGVLVTGRRIGAQEAILDVVGELAHTEEVLEGFCEIEGERLVVIFRYIGLLPH